MRSTTARAAPAVAPAPKRTGAGGTVLPTAPGNQGRGESAAFAARLDGWVEDENRVALLCLLQRELEHVRIREAVDRRRLFRSDLARQRRLRADRLSQRSAQLLLEVGAVEVDDVLRRVALLRRHERDDVVHVADVLERVERELERLAAHEPAAFDRRLALRDRARLA